MNESDKPTSWKETYPSLNSFKKEIDQLKEPKVPKEVDWTQEGRNTAFQVVQFWLDKCVKDSDQIIHSPTKLFSSQHFIQVLEAFQEANFAHLSNETEWVHQSEGDTANIHRKLVPEWKTMGEYEEIKYKLYAMQLGLEEGAKVNVWGDLHGSVHSLLRTIQPFIKRDTWKFEDDKNYFFFLGDFVDRGPYSVETLYCLLRLKLENMDRIHLIRGDHELPQINIGSNGSLVKEIKSKFAPILFSIIFNKISECYHYFCPVLFAHHKAEQHKRYLMMCHGGLEMGIDLTNLLKEKKDRLYCRLTSIDRSKFIKTLEDGKLKDDLIFKQTRYYVKQEEKLSMVGFIWSDFLVADAENSFERGRGWVLSKSLSEAIIANYQKTCGVQIVSIFRGHQHYEGEKGFLWNLIESNGLYAIWGTEEDEVKEWNLLESKSLVYTVLSAPGSCLLFNRDNFISLQFKSEQQWILSQNCFST